jgi:ABC-2 type transport system permease protein
MNHLQAGLVAAWDVARRELAATFRSPVALVFLAVFLLSVNVGFFTLSGFFARGLADVRPLFSWLPSLLLVLVSAWTMRQWAEERKTGTLELLLTLPVPTWALVLGKFLAGLGLIAAALSLTLPLPAMVAFFGPLDFGPVVGGYLAALLVGAVYLALGLCVSSQTDNQVVSLILTLIAGGALLLVGHPTLTSLFPEATADWMRAISVSARFESVERGVVDARDLAYHLGLVVTFLALNVVFLQVPRVDRQTHPGRVGQIWLTWGLTALNALLLSLWTHPLSMLRLDLTADGSYSLSPITLKTIADLEEPLYVEVYVSGRTHPLLSPLLPRLRDTLREYGTRGGSGIELTFADPAEDDNLAARIGEKYGIESVPFGVSDRSSESVVNAYFHVLVRYGDQFQVLQMEDLVDFDANISGTEVQVRLGDIEYALTRAIRKVSRGFQSTEAMLARLPSGSKATLYTTPDRVPTEFQASLDEIRRVAQEMATKSGGRLTFEEVTPTPEVEKEIAAQYGVRPLAADLLGLERFYASLVLVSGDLAQRLGATPSATEGDGRRSLEAAIRRAVPGQMTSIGIATERPAPPPSMPGMPPQRSPGPDYGGLRQVLLQGYQVEQVDLSAGRPPDHVDVLILGKLGTLTDKQRWAVDQYLMRGGSVIALAGAKKADLQGSGGLAVVPSDADLRALLAHYGANVEDALVLDPQNAPFPLPVEEQRGPYVLRRIELLPYPFFPDVRSDGMDRSHAAIRGLPNLTVPWASPVRLAEPLADGVVSSVFLQSSARSWTQTTDRIDPDFQTYPDLGFGPASGATVARVPLAVTLTGTFKSWFADKPSPVWDGASEAKDVAGRTQTIADANARLAVIGSSEFASDLMFQLINGPGGEIHGSNLELVQNLIDWSVEDTDLLSIRSAGSFSRTLPRWDEGQRASAEGVAWVAGLIPLALLVVGPLVLGRRLPPELRRFMKKEGE